MQKIFLLLFLISLSSYAQNFTVSGYMEDDETGEKLIGATVFIPSETAGTLSNTYGFYSVTLPKGTYEFQFTYIGYQPEIRTIDLSSDQTLNINLKPSLTLKEVEVVVNKVEKIQENTQMSKIDVPISQIKALPAFLGEVDIMKAIQLLPGVQSGSEGGSGIYVRGGGPDQNLILLDGVPVYNASHLLGMFSVFNADAVKNVELIKGGFPARYGGRLSSVVNISMKEGNTKEIHGSGSISVISSKLTVEGPIIKDRTAFILSGRRSYIDLLTRPLIKKSGSYDNSGLNSNGNSYENSGNDSGGYYLQDFNAKINHKFSEKDRLYLSAYTGRDKGFAKSKYFSKETKPNGDIVNENSEDIDFSLGWGNFISTLRWNHQFSKKLFSNTSLIYSNYDFNVDIDYKDKYFNVYEEPELSLIDTFSYDDKNKLEYLSGIKDYGVKLDFDYIPKPNQYIKFGGNVTHHEFSPGVISIKEESTGEVLSDTSYTDGKVNATEAYLYIEDDIKLTPRLKANIGLHGSVFGVQDTAYWSVQPRLSMRYLISDDWSVKASYANMTQYLHLLTSSNISLPTDLWVPPTKQIGPQRSWQVALGTAYTISEGLEISAEGYYKEMKDLISYKEGNSFVLLSDSWENAVTVGDGKSYGAEVFLQKKTGRTTGWLGYTLSKTDRTFKEINNGNTYPYRYDRRHDISLALTHQINEKWDVGVVWVYGTGNAVSLPRSNYDAYNESDFQETTTYGDYYPFGNQGDITTFGEKNDYRMASYHRLDIAFNRKTKRKWGEGIWTFGAYNVYNRRNPFLILESTDYDFETNSSKQVYEQFSLFPILPNISYAFKF